MVKKLIDEIKEKLKEFKTKEDKVKYLKKVLEETDNEELKELVLELIEELENSLEQIVEQAPMETKPTQSLKLQQDPEYKPSERSQAELTRDPIREPTEAHYSRNENTQYVIAPTASTQTADQSDLVSRLRGNLRRKNLLPSGNLVPTTAVKEQMMVEIKREFNNNISSERLQNYVDLFTTGSFKKYETKDKKEENEIEYNLMES